MSRVVRHPQTSFTGGEIDPRLFGRIDMTRYLSGMSLARNVVVKIQGGVRRRGGLRHVAVLDDGLTGIRLHPFAFSTTQTYFAALTGGKLRMFNRNGANIYTTSSVPWTLTQLFGLDWSQTVDTAIICHKDFAPQRIRRGASESVWTIGAVPISNIPAFDYGAITPAGTITPSAVSGTITLTASAATFTASMVGWQFFGDGARARITAFTDSTHVTAEVLGNFRTGTGAATVATDVTGAFDKTQATEEFPADLDPITQWSLEEPVISAARGWPAASTFHEGRWYLGGFRSRPASFMGSVVGDYFNFDQGSGLDDRAIYATLDGEQVNPIRRLVSSRTLQLFTDGAEIAVTSDPPITPKNVSSKEQTSWGIEPDARTTSADGNTLFIQRVPTEESGASPDANAALRQFVYSDLERAWNSELISLLSGHVLTRPTGIFSRRGTSGTEGSQTIVINSDGSAALLTMARDHQIVAFTSWDTDGEFLDGVSLLSGEVFFAVRRNGEIHLEKWDERAFLDGSVLVTNATPFNQVAGLEHLAGMTVGIIMGDVWKGTGTVSDAGILTLPGFTTKAEVGCVFTPKVHSMPIEPRDPTGNMIGRKCRVVELALRVNDTASFTVNGNPVIGPSAGVGEESPLDAPPPRMTDDVVVRGMTGWRDRHIIEIEQPIPGPFELLGMSHKIQIGGL